MPDPSSFPPARAKSSLWMELEELSSADFKARLADEFPQGAALWEEGLSRRRFLQLMSASLALAGLNGCMRLPDEKIVPYTDQPEKVIPGRPLHFATTLQIHGHPRGVIVTSNEGRPTHIAGNPLHPLSLGAADIWTTAAVLDLYDPDRLQNVLFKQGVSTWDAFAQRATRMQAELAQTKGDGFCILTGPVNSPTELALLSQLLTEYPSARWYQHDPLSGGEPEAQLNLADTDVIFSLDSDFLFDRPDSLALIRAFSKRRKSDDGSSWNRLYVAEPCPTITGAKADHRFIIRPHELEPLAAALLDAVQGKPATDSRWPWLSAVVDDLCAHPERSVLMAGRSASFATQRMVAAANRALRSFGNTVVSLPPVWTRLLPIGTLADLASDAARGSVGTLLILDGNPVFDAPSDLRMGDWLPKIPNTIHHTLFANETSAQCEWVIHAAHDLEAWGDARGVDGTASIIQPLIAPLYDGKSAIELLSLLAGPPGGSAYELVRETWTAVSGLKEDAFEAQWHRWLRDGVVTLPVHDGPYTVVAPAFGSSVAPSGKAGPSTASPAQPVPASSAGTLDPNAIVLNLRPGAAMWDGRHANNGWLQELPDPTTKLTWDNAALLSPGTAGELEVTDGEVILLQTSTGSVEAPVLVIPGHADKCVTLALGYGRTVCGSVGTAVGVNGYPLRSSDALWHVPLEKVEKTGRTHPLARTQEHFRMEGRDLLHVARVDQRAPVLVAAPPPPSLPSLYPEFPYDGHKWALTIDLNACVGCNACIVACQSENNIPVVGKEQVLFGREMQWIRVDRYYQGPADAPRTHFQPVTCMQCEKAPCEVVCPVAATQHDDEGLNVMVYNRCVGTRYCSNNCPYKVRRFNFLFYNSDIPETRRLQLNPNVTVRSRGVMEKCTYCVQRIEEARISARREHRPLRGDDIVTACQAACPAEAITFGDLSDPASAVSQNRKKPGHYAMLEELDTKPRTTYLEKQINVNPVLEPKDNSGAI